MERGRSRLVECGEGEVYSLNYLGGGRKSSQTDKKRCPGFGRTQRRKRGDSLLQFERDSREEEGERFSSGRLREEKEGLDS